MGDADPSNAASEITNNLTFEKFARAGFVASAFLHLIIGYLAIRIAFGKPSQTADQSGALAELANKPFGALTLWLCVAAFGLMALWQVAKVIAGRSPDHPTGTGAAKALVRLEAIGLVAVYFVLAFSAFSFAHGAGERSGDRSVDVSTHLMQSGIGRAALIVAGVVTIAIGGYHVYKGVRRKFVHDLKLAGASSKVVLWIGTIGYVAKGLAIAGVGLLFIVATIHAQPGEATGLDGVLKTLGAQAYGQILLIVAGVGIIIFGLYDFAIARYEKM